MITKCLNTSTNIYKCQRTSAKCQKSKQISMNVYKVPKMSTKCQLLHAVPSNIFSSFSLVVNGTSYDPNSLSSSGSPFHSPVDLLMVMLTK